MADNLIHTTQESFGGALNAVVAPHVLQPTEVAAGTNVDFSLEWEGALARQGSIQYGSLGTAAPVYLLARNYGLSTGTWTDTGIPWYAASPTGVSYRYGPNSTLPPSTPFISINSGTGSFGGGATQQIIPQATQYNGVVYLANGTSALKENGASDQLWLLPQAATPAVTFQPQFQNSPPFVGFYGTETYTATEGTVTGTSTTTAFTSATTILTSAASGAGTRIVLVGTCSVTNWEDPVAFKTLDASYNSGTGTVVTSGAGTYTMGGLIDFHQGWPNGDVTGASGSWSGTSTVTQTLTLGSYGVDYILLSLPSQQNVVTIQRDLSVGDANFTNYWHYETTPDRISDATIDPISAILAQASIANTPFDNQSQIINANRGNLTHVNAPSNVNVSAIRRNASATSISNSISPWAVSRSDYSFIGALSNPDFSNIQAVRIIIEFNQSLQTAIVGGVVTYGGVGYCLNDQASGISYYQTYAVVENGNIVEEGAASVPSPPQKTQFSNAAIAVSDIPDTAATGITHRVFYRTGGFLQDAYRVGSAAITGQAGTITLYDYALPDMLIIGNPTLRRNLWSKWPSPTAGTGLPGVSALSLPWQQRIWIGVQNQLYWTYPGVPSQIQDNSQTTVGDLGDGISAIHPGQNLIIVNQNSVYELAGSIFEGLSQNWTLSKTQARRGSAAPRTCINTPNGVVLFGYDGISMYRGGFGIDQDLDWVYARIGDLWKGTGTTDPALTKHRIPPMNLNNIFNSVAAYKDEKLYLAVPTGSNTYADTMFILDFAHQRVWMYQYPFFITSLYWDRLKNRLFAGTSVGGIHQLEVGLTDALPNGTATGIPWSVTTREWTDPKDKILENLQAEVIGTGTWLVDINNTSTNTLGTFTQSAKGWSPISLQGSLGENIGYVLQGTQSGTQQGVYSLQWDSIPQVPEVFFYQTDPMAPPSKNYIKTWVADVNVLSSTTPVFGTLLMDGTAIQTATFSQTIVGIAGRRKFEVGCPNITDGKSISVKYSSTSPFRYYGTDYETEPKPFGKTTWLVTYKKAGGASQADMARFYAMDIEGPAVTSLTSTWIIDGTAFTTNTLTFGATDAGEDAGIVRNYYDQIPFPPGGRGYLFQQQLTGAQPFWVWRASLDFDRIGVKGLSRVTQNGSPSPGSE